MKTSYCDFGIGKNRAQLKFENKTWFRGLKRGQQNLEVENNVTQFIGNKVVEFKVDWESSMVC